MAAAESTKHQRFDHRFGDLAGGGPIHHEVGAGSAPDVRGGDEDFNGRERLQRHRRLEVVFTIFPLVSKYAIRRKTSGRVSEALWMLSVTEKSARTFPWLIETLE